MEHADIVVDTEMNDVDAPTSPQSAPLTETPLPLRKMAVLAFILLNESLCATMLFPVVGLLVARLETESVNDAGYQCGLLVGIFQLGQVVSGKIWGRFSDQYGRRPALIAGALLSGIVMLFFGLSSSFWVCLFLRLMHGFFNGNVLVAKAVIGEITDRTNESKGFTVVSMSWGMGCLVGPAIGGYLYDPASSSALSHLGFHAGGIFDTHPALLPSLVISTYSLLAASIAFFLFEETNKQARPFSELLDGVSSRVNALRKRVFNASRHERTALPTDVDDNNAMTETVPTVMQAIPTFGYREALMDSRTRTPLIVYALLSAYDIAFVEVLPLWAIADNDVGGLGFGHSKIGTVILMGSVPTLTANFLFPSVRKWFHDDVRMWRTIVIVASVVTILISTVSDLSSPMIPLIAVNFLRLFPTSWCFSMSFVLIARSAPREHMGAMNGIGQSAGCVTRALVPPIVAPLFAWSIEPDRFIHVFPFDHSLTFVIAVGLLLASLPLMQRIDRDLVFVPPEPVVIGLPPVAERKTVPDGVPSSDTLSL